ncbi:MAG: Rrf2 family transcriptional regulator [Acidaminococcales bacterium]|jgi:Rrf2 family protein|nr:Rrf2 family transcriptional regulator [Acidaminococcales bacterium]
MRISAKGRYALAAIIEVARSSRSKETVAVIAIAQKLGISKIYLEQIFSQLKKSELLLSTKGSHGGYILASPPQGITAWDVLSAVEAMLVEPTEASVGKEAPEIEMALQNVVFQPLDKVVRECLKKITLQSLLDFSEKQRLEQAYMLNM